MCAKDGRFSPVRGGPGAEAHSSQTSGCVRIVRPGKRRIDRPEPGQRLHREVAGARSLFDGGGMEARNVQFIADLFEHP